MRTRLLLLSLLLLLALPAASQISGRVLSAADGEPLAGATVLAEDREGKHLAYCLTDREGHFAFKKEFPAATQLSVSLMSFATQKVSLVGATFPLEISLEEQPFELKEVSVRAKSIFAQGDTVTYLVSAFAGKNDRTIGEVLKRMPGVEVDDAGKISYQGVDINRFYIEGKDLMQDRYGVATKGISPDDIGAVEVLEHHQPMQVLQGVSLSDQAAINLKLKEGRRAAWLVHGSAGGGYMQSPRRGLWTGELFALRASSTTQSLLSLKTNDTGVNVVDEMQEFSNRRRTTALSSPLALSLVSAPALLPRRTMLNKSGMATLNHLWSITPMLQAKLMADYLEDHRSATGGMRTTYLSPEGDQEIVEERDDRTRHRMWRGRLTLEANRPTYYLSNVTRAELAKDRPELVTTGTFANRQRGDEDNLYFANDLELIRRIAGNHLITINSVNEWESLPSRLHLLSEGTEAMQTVSDRAFSTQESLSYSYQWGRVGIGGDVAVQGLFRRFGATGDETLPAAVTATQRLHLYGLTASPTLTWRRSGLEATLDLPMEYSHYSFGGAHPARDFFLLSPAASLTWQFRSGLSLSLRGGGGRSPVSPDELFSGQLMTDYRTVTAGYEELLLRSMYNLSGRIFFRDASKGLFTHLMVLYNESESPYRLRRDLTDDGLLHISYEEESSRLRNLMVNGQLNGLIDLIHGGGGLTASYSRTAKSALAEGSPVDYTTDLVMLKGMLNSDITSRLHLTCEGSYNGSHLDLSIPGRSPQWLHTFVQTVEVTYVPLDPLMVVARGEYYSSPITAEQRKEMVMLDLKLSWRFSRKVELNLDLNNLLNNNVWSYTTYGLLTEQTVSRQLRGRELLLTLLIK